MPAQNPSSGPSFIWIVACFLFICVLAGGGCLASYMLLPESETAPWLPVVGVILVCLPWLFWIFTFLYRVLSRASGYRIGATAGGGGGGANFTNASGNIVGVGPQGNGHQDGPNGLTRASSAASHESEMPLNSSMAS